MRDLLFKPALELAELVRSGEVSSRELVQASLDAIDAVDGDLNAWVLVDADQALETAASIGPGDERPFAGVPMAIKDLYCPVAGTADDPGLRAVRRLHAATTTPRSCAATERRASC